MTNFTDVAAVDEIPPGEARAFLVDGKMVGVFNCDGELLAINDLCPHAGASLSAGYVENEVVSCPWHAWRFNIRDGTWCDNPKLKVDTYEVKVVGDRILVGIPALDEEQERNGEPDHDQDQDQERDKYRDKDQDQDRDQDKDPVER